MNISEICGKDASFLESFVKQFVEDTYSKYDFLLAFIVLFFYLSAQNTIVALIRDESRKIKVIWKMKIYH